METTNIRGQTGGNGKPGSSPDKQAYIKLIYYENRKSTWKSSETRTRTWLHTDNDVSRREECPNPHKKTLDANSKGKQMPETQTEFDTTVVIFEYLALVRAKQIDHIHKNEISEFAQLILSNKQVLSGFTTLHFIDHLLSLETEFFQYKDQMSFAPHYQAVINSIEIYAENKGDLTDEEKKVSFYYNF